MEFTHFSMLPPHILDGIQFVHEAVFGDLLKVEKLEGKQRLIALVCIIDKQVAGFKLGYEVEPGVFYSWLGGVHPQFQQRGIAKKLMERQHELIKEYGYHTVRTYSRNSRRAMLLLNIKSGFDVIDTFIDHKGRHKIRLEKQL